MTANGTVKTERLLLRPLADEDTESIWAIHSDPLTNEYNPAGPMTEHVKAAELAREWAGNWTAGGHGYWAIEELQAPGSVIGFGGIRATLWRGREVYNLYYRLSPTVWGKGFAGELVAAAVAQWHELGERLPLIAYTTAENVPSQKTAASGGLTRRPDLDEVGSTYTDVVFALGLD